MKITEIHIASFGGLKDKTISPGSGFNIIYGDNEAGKTTVMTFIRAVFYGAGANRGTDLSKKIREKYAPWSGEPMMGSITFEHEGRRYRIERTFGKTDRQDNATLFDLDLGTQEKVTAGLGERFFGIGLDAFTRCFFVGEGGKIDTRDGELSGKLSAIAQTGDETVSHDTVIKNLSHGRELLRSKSGKKGTLVDDEKLFSELNDQLNAAEETENRINALAIQSDEETKKLHSLEEERNGLRALIEKYHKFKNAQSRKELESYRQKLDGINAVLIDTDGGAVTRETTENLGSAYKIAESLREQIEENEKETEKAHASVDLSAEEEAEKKTEETKNRLEALCEEKHRISTEIGKLQRELSRADAEAITKKSRKKPFSVPFLITAILFVIIGISLFFLPTSKQSVVPGAVSLGIALSALILAFILRPADKAAAREAEAAVKRIEADVDGAQNKLAGIERDISDCDNCLANLRISFDKEKTRREGELAALSERKTKLESQLYNAEDHARRLLMSICGESDISVIPDKVAELSEAITERERTETQISMLQKQLSDSETESPDTARAPEDDVDITSVDFKAVSARVSELDGETSEQNKITARIEAELLALSKSFESPEGIRKKLDVLKEKIEEKKRFIEISELASNVISDSFAELRRDYGGVINTKTLDIFSRLTGGRYKDVSVSKEFGISAERDGIFGTKDIGYLSTGTVDQAYLSLRLTIAEMISGENRIPVMMDDALSQYDDTRASLALSFLTEYAKNTQILLFTCHGQIRDEGEKAGADIISL